MCISVRKGETEYEATTRPGLFRRIKPGKGSLSGEHLAESCQQTQQRESTFPYRPVVYNLQSGGKGLGSHELPWQWELGIVLKVLWDYSVTCEGSQLGLLSELLSWMEWRKLRVIARFFRLCCVQQSRQGRAILRQRNMGLLTVM